MRDMSIYRLGAPKGLLPPNPIEEVAPNAGAGAPKPPLAGAGEPKPPLAGAPNGEGVGACANEPKLEPA